jgi:VanZ family protein
MIEPSSRLHLPAGRIFARYWLPVIAYAGLIILLSSFPIRFRHAPFPYYDKVFHFIEYGIYAGLWYRALWKTTRLSSYGWAWMGFATILVCTVFGVGDELYQTFTPYRSSDRYDLAADASGAIAAVLLSAVRGFIARS